MGGCLEGSSQESRRNGLATFLVLRGSESQELFLTVPYFVCKFGSMLDTGLRVVVDRHDVIITQPGSNALAIYFKPRGQQYLVAKDAPVGPQEFTRRAWEAAIAKARELDWIR